MIAAFLVCSTLIALDGDTVKCLPAGYNMRLIGGGTPNVIGIDAPEMGKRAKCGRELILAEDAKRRLADLLVGRLRIEMVGIDVYNRPLVNIYGPQGEIGQIMLKEGHARVWKRGKHVDWCG